MTTSGRVPRNLGRIIVTGPRPIRTISLSADQIDASRFWRHVDTATASGCWLWTGSTKASGGYGQFRITEGVNARPHRVAWTLLVGPIPEGLVLDHLCRVRNCVNPSHLEPVTVRVNTLRGNSVASDAMRAFERGVCTRGHTLAVTGMRANGRGRACNQCRIDDVRRWREARAAS